MPAGPIALARRALPALALLGLATALLWWWWTFAFVVDNGYMAWTEASRCLVNDSDICALAKALCLGSHPRALASYHATSFWIGAALLSMSLWATAARGASSKIN